MVANLPTPTNPEHHYRYDPAKAVSFSATALAWVGDPAAVGFARAAVTGSGSRPRRVASARLDLALALLAADSPEEACAEALTAVTSGWIAPSNWWRVTEVVSGVAQTGAPGITDLREACHAFRPLLGGRVEG